MSKSGHVLAAPKKKIKLTAKYRRRATKLLMAHLDPSVDVSSPLLDNRETVDITNQFIVPHEYYTDTPAWGTTINHRVSFTILNHPYTACKQLQRELGEPGKLNGLWDILEALAPELRSDLAYQMRILYNLNVTEETVDAWKVIIPFPMAACLLDIYRNGNESPWIDNITVPTATWLKTIATLKDNCPLLDPVAAVCASNVNVAARQLNKIKRFIEQNMAGLTVEAMRELLVNTEDLEIIIEPKDLDTYAVFWVERITARILELLATTALLLVSSAANVNQAEVTEEDQKAIAENVINDAVTLATEDVIEYNKANR